MDGVSLSSIANNATDAAGMGLLRKAMDANASAAMGLINQLQPARSLNPSVGQHLDRHA